MNPELVDKNVKKVVLFSTRRIEDMKVFRSDDSVVGPTLSPKLAGYFLSLKDALSTLINSCATSGTPAYSLKDAKEELTKFVNEVRVPLDTDTILLANHVFDGYNDSVSKTIKDAKKTTELFSLIVSITGCVQNQPEMIQRISEIRGRMTNAMGQSGGNVQIEQNKAENPMNAKVTHMDYCGTSPAKIIHRIGIYCSTDGEYAVCAVWPWADKYEKNHSEAWKKTLIESVIAWYPNVERLILMLHDADFEEYCHKKDEVIDNDVNVALQIKNGNGRTPIVPFTVFQHSNQYIKNIMLANDTVKKVFDSIMEYVDGFSTLIDSDKSSWNARAHEAALKLKEN